MGCCQDGFSPAAGGGGGGDISGTLTPGVIPIALAPKVIGDSPISYDEGVLNWSVNTSITGVVSVTGDINVSGQIDTGALVVAGAAVVGALQVLGLAGVGVRLLAVDATGVVGVVGGVPSGSGTANKVAYWSGTNTLTADTDFGYDGTNLTLAGGNFNVNGAVNTATYMINLAGGNLSVARVAGGGGAISSFGVGTPADLAAGNYEVFQMFSNGTNALLRVLQGGTGVYRDLLIQNGGVTAITVATNQNVSLSAHLLVNGATSFTNYGISVKDKHVATSGGFGHRAFGLGVPGDTNTEFAFLSHSGASAFLTVTQSGTGSYRDLVIQNGGSTQLTVNAAGGIIVANTSRLTGAVVIGASAPIASEALWVNTTTLSGASQYGGDFAPDFSSSATTAGTALGAQLRTAAASFTMANGYGLRVFSANKGAGSNITTAYGIKVEDQSAGVTNYGLYTGAGLVRLGGAVTAPSIQLNGTTVLSDYTEATFNVGMSGLTSVPSATVRAVRIGKIVQMTIENIGGTSNAALTEFTGIPAAWRPVNTQYVEGFQVDIGGGGTVYPARVLVSNSGSWTLEYKASFAVNYSSAFPTTGTKGSFPATFTYNLL